MKSFGPSQFPALSQKKQPAFIYLDSASTTLRPRAVITAESKFLETDYANVHRGVYGLAERATKAYESGRNLVAKFLGALPAEIIFTKNATEGLNILAFGLARGYLKKGDTIVLSALEHHANLVPWQEVARLKGLKIKFIPLKKDGALDLKKAALLIKKARVVAITAASNVTGYLVPLEKIAHWARQAGALFIVDACQAVLARPLNVKKIPCDALVFSAHKIYGPTGLGVLYLKKDLQEKIPPLLYGGNMISQVAYAKTDYRADQQKYEAGTPPISQVVALVACLKWLQKIGFKKIYRHQRDLALYLKHKLARLAFIKIASCPSASQVSSVSFVVKGAHAHDVATFLNEQGLCVRAGWHCAEPLIRQSLRLPPLVRVSFGLYNTKDQIDKLVEVLRLWPRVFKK